MEEKLSQKDKAIIHKDNSLHRLDLSFIKHIDLEEYKKTHLLSYWIKDFAEYHDEERTFDTTNLITFKRGNVIKVNLGFNIGYELGGLHYCLVLDKYDNPKNGTLNIIPLTSKKDKKYPPSAIDLGSELYDNLNKLYRNQRDKISNEYANIWNLPSDKIKNIAKEFEYISKIEQEIKKIKKGSIALINQITTISKQRIFDDDVLRNVKLSSNSLDLIDKGIMKYFTK